MIDKKTKDMTVQEISDTTHFSYRGITCNGAAITTSNLILLAAAAATRENKVEVDKFVLIHRKIIDAHSRLFRLMGTGLATYQKRKTAIVELEKLEDEFHKLMTGSQNER